MNKYQNINFGSVRDFLAFLPDEELKLVQLLRGLVMECIPDVKEKLAYNVPFYYRFSRICFIWPGSVPWGRKTKAGVELGFCRGNMLSDASYLNIGGRKEVYIKTFYEVNDIDADILRQLIYEAVVVDEEVSRKKQGGRLGLRQRPHY
jgi:hypothetical protein